MPGKTSGVCNRRISISGPGGKIYFFAAAAYHRPHLAGKQALVYGVTGGIPHYLNKLEIEQDVDAAIRDNLLQPSSSLFEEPENLLKQELREPAIYNSVISAIAGGASHANEISTKVGLDSGICAKYLHVLLELGILKKESPMAEKPGKKTIYTIEDNFFRFWYCFVPRNMSLIHAGRIQAVYEQAVKRFYPEYMGLVFEKMCREYLLRYAEDLPFLLSEAGQWWGTDARTKKEVQIDIVGLPVEGKEYLIASCKYRNEKIGVEELELLQQYAFVFRANGQFRYYIFSKGGFSQALLEREKQGDVTLLTLEDLYSDRSKVPENSSQNG